MALTFADLRGDAEALVGLFVGGDAGIDADAPDRVVHGLGGETRQRPGNNLPGR